jgi:hypothetical protein
LFHDLLRFPHALVFLDLLQQPDFCLQMAQPNFTRYLSEQQQHHYHHYVRLRTTIAHDA